MSDASVRDRFSAAVVQLNCQDQVGPNLEAARQLIARAAEQGAELVVLPENAVIMGRTDRDKLAHAEAPGDGPLQAFFAEQARRHGVWLVVGTLPLRRKDPGRVRAASLLFDDQGRMAARYDKLHLFDVRVSAEEAYRESDTLEPGDEVRVVSTPFGRLGMSVCYDLRFPELFRAMVDRGAELFTVPSAFTTHTGRAHWLPLLQARAVENLCYVLAPDQVGVHPSGRETYGHSVIVSPLGPVSWRPWPTSPVSPWPRSTWGSSARCANAFPCYAIGGPASETGHADEM